jgi:hypothetical protein
MSEPAKANVAIASASEAEHALANLNKIMDRLVETVEEETARTRAGKLTAATELDEPKAELTYLYAAESERVKNARDLIAQSLPEALDALQKRHQAFRALLQTNLTVLATAHAVSEGIIRGVSGELARKQAPSTYGASGRANALGAKASQPLALSRTL